MNETDIAALGNALWKKAAESPDNYEANRDFAQFCIDNLHVSFEIIDLAQQHIAKTLSFGRQGPETEQFLITLADIFQLRGDFAEESNVLKAILSLYPNDLTYLRRLGFSLHNQGNIREASTVFQQGEMIDHETAKKACQQNGMPFTRIIAQDHDPAGHIGELAVTLDLYIKSRELGHTGHFGDDADIVFLADKQKTANWALAEYWMDKFTIISDPETLGEHRKKLGKSVITTDFFQVQGNITLHMELAARALQMEWEAKEFPPLLKVKESHIKKGKDFLRSHGAPEDAWFAALHVREGGYHAWVQQSPFTKYRSADIQSYLPAIKKITDRGGWVVRLGDPSMCPLPEMPNVIDYAHSEHREDWLDIFFMGAARFFIATPSGPYNVSAVFGVPAVGTNWIPFVTWPFSRHDVFIPRLLRSTESGELLTVRQTLTPPFLHSYSGFVLGLHKVEACDSTEDEIEDAVNEMMDRLDGVHISTDEDENLQRSFRAQVIEFGGETVELCKGLPDSRICTAFLKKHRQILE